MKKVDAERKDVRAKIMVRSLFSLLCVASLLISCAPSYDGELLWTFETKKTHRQWAAVDEQRFYLCADDVYCLERSTGRLLWEFASFGVHSSAPVITDSTLFFQCGGLYALDAETGDVRWEFWTRDWATVSPVVACGLVYAPVGGRLFCLDAATGKRLWSVSTGPIKSTPVVLGNRLFYSSAAKIVCLDISSRKELWRFDVGSANVNLVLGEHYLLSGCFAGIVRAHEFSTGEVQWQFSTATPIMRMRVSAAGQAFVCAGALYCLNPLRGDLLWKFQQDQAFVFDAQVLDAYALVRGPKQGLLCISINDGSFIRRLQMPEGGRLLEDPDNAIFFPSARNRAVVCLSLPRL